MNFRKVCTNSLEKLASKWSDKTWIDDYIKDYKCEISVNSKKNLCLFCAFCIFVRYFECAMGHSEDVSKDKLSRIKFKSDEGQSLASETAALSARKLRKNELSVNALRTSSDLMAEALDDDICYHKDCCFAYNITADARNPALLVECLTPAIYQKLATMWDLDPTIVPKASGNTCKRTQTEREEENRMVEEYIKNVERDLGIRSELSDDLQVDAGSLDKSDYSDDDDFKQTIRKKNPYLKFLKKAKLADSKQKKKPNLGKQAGKMTKMIIGNFMKWYETLGAGEDEQSFIDEQTLHELFQVGFDMPAAKPMAIRIKEMPTVPECLASLRNEPKHATTYALRKYLKQDIKLENIPMKMFAFGSMLPKEKNLRYKPPRNYVYKTWMECSRVPKDLSSMKTVWVGLERLRSTIAFSNWLKNHPEISPPAYLQEKGLLNINYEEWNQMYKGFEFDVAMDAVGTDTKIPHEKSISKASSGMSYMSNSIKFEESSDSFL